jgi:hypothetical protein
MKITTISWFSIQNVRKTILGENFSGTFSPESPGWKGNLSSHTCLPSFLFNRTVMLSAASQLSRSLKMCRQWCKIFICEWRVSVISEKKVMWRWSAAQSRQSDKLFSPLVGLGLPHPLTRRRVPIPTRGNTRTQCMYTCTLICTLWSTV